MTTLKDIAKLAGVSVMTVSRVVNGNFSKVSEKTTRRIQTIIEETGYVPNHSARSLINKQSNIVAVILRNESMPDDPYTAKMLSSIIPFLQKNGYYAMVTSLENFYEINHHLKAWRAAGAIFLGLFEEDLKALVSLDEIPLIFTDSYVEGYPMNNVGIDNYQGGVLAAEHLIESGHQHLAFITGALEKSPISQARYLGFTDTIRKHGLSINDLLVFSDVSADIICKTLLGSNATGIFATADMLALQVMDQMNSHGVRLPEAYSIIGFDDLPLIYYVTPKLTTITQDIEEKAKVACNLLMKHMKDRTLPYENHILEVRLIKRDSVSTT